MTMTGLRTVESKIDEFRNWECPCGLPEVEDVSVKFLDPRVWMNRGTREVTNCVVNSTTRVVTAVPTAFYDIGCAAIYLDQKHLVDGVVTIPKACAHLIVDTIEIAGIGIAGTVVTVGIVGYGALWCASSAINCAGSLIGKSFGRIYNA